MYTYEELIPKNIDQILNLYSQEDIFNIVFEEYPDYNSHYLSPFRDDRHPNCFFDWYKGKLYFRDYADIQRDCFDAVKDYFRLDNLTEVFSLIHLYYQEHKPLNRTQFHEYRNKCSKFYDIVTVERPYELKDELFWKQYYITKAQLDEDLVYPVSRYRFYAQKKKKWITLTPFDIAYAISGFDRCKKIYRPRNKGKNKWMTNCSSNEIGNINNISKELDYLIITKSYKDHRVIRNDGYKNTVWFQSEKQIPDNKVLSDLVKDFNFILIFYDNDETGISGGKQVEKKVKEVHREADVKCLHSPFKFFKDPASIVSNKSRNDLHSILWNSFQK